MAVARFRRLVHRVPPRPRAVLRLAWEAALNRMPAWPFLASRRRYAGRLRSSAVAEPPVLLRVAAFRKRIPPDVDSFEMLGRPGLSMVNVESIATRVIFWTGANWVARHAAGLEVWEQLCRRAARIVELGANVGYYAIAGAPAARGTYTAFEPHPRSCDGLRRNLDLNGIDRVAVHEAAAVAEPGVSTVELICPTGNDRDAPSGAMVKGSSFELDDLARETETVLVRAEPFTSAIAGSDLVKIDVEGLEAQLLTSGWGQLVVDKPAVMVEVHEHNRELRALLPRLITDLDATAFAMRRDHLVRVQPGDLEHGVLGTYGTYDFLIVPSERSGFVDGLVRG